jgi:hypothetical protein
MELILLRVLLDHGLLDLKVLRAQPEIKVLLDLKVELDYKVELDLKVQLDLKVELDYKDLKE